MVRPKGKRRFGNPVAASASNTSAPVRNQAPAPETVAELEDDLPF